MESYLVDVAVLVDALNKTITVGRSLRTIDNHLCDARLLIVLASGIANESHTTIRLHKTWILGQRGIWVHSGADVDTTDRLCNKISLIRRGFRKMNQLTSCKMTARMKRWSTNEASATCWMAFQI